jgi:hypothetical protein
MHGVTSWSGVPATYLRSPVVRYRCAPPAGGNHYLFNSRVQMGWVSAPQPVLVMLL